MKEVLLSCQGEAFVAQNCMWDSAALEYPQSDLLEPQLGDLGTLPSTSEKLRKEALFWKDPPFLRSKILRMGQVNSSCDSLYSSQSCLFDTLCDSSQLTGTRQLASNYPTFSALFHFYLCDVDDGPVLYWFRISWPLGRPSYSSCSHLPASCHTGARVDCFHRWLTGESPKVLGRSQPSDPESSDHWFNLLILLSLQTCLPM